MASEEKVRDIIRMAQGKDRKYVIFYSINEENEIVVFSGVDSFQIDKNDIRLMFNKGTRSTPTDEEVIKAYHNRK
ncbi:hypothetical protein M2480_001780 [Parabacteroides sp. PFB2-12]|uniref:hypothetical protein n=1 Tax=unclassified Parabacteroides TaxID=2649774 RepID=UPI002474E819|nr:MULTISPECIES: hypothetical protein [unclassified Parabacteroides]MDH6343154.1 hypothetical protein [Parabacteroides sp. PM6-13]MDH6390798.1 hypothetical protein [Parabacteroides sp. PFB2-12]